MTSQHTYRTVDLNGTRYDIRKLKDLQSENQALKQIVADQALLIEASKKLLRKNGLRPPTEGRGPAS